jgi:hypothetical protein
LLFSGTLLLPPKRLGIAFLILKHLDRPPALAKSCTGPSPSMPSRYKYHKEPFFILPRRRIKCPQKWTFLFALEKKNPSIKSMATLTLI